MSYKNLFTATALSGAALLTGCATGPQSNDPCYGTVITPHTAYNRGMTEASAGLQRRNDFNRGGYRTGYYNGFGSPIRYGFLGDQNKPSEVVYTVTSRNNQVHDIKFQNNSTDFNKIALGVVGLAVGSQIGGHQVANAVIGGVAGVFAGKQLDNVSSDSTAERIKACVRDVQAGNQDYVVPVARPAGGVLPNPQSEGRGFRFQ